MAKMPTTDEWVEKIGNKVINEFVYEGRTLKEWIDLIAKGKCMVFPTDATNGDIIQNICSMWIEYHDTDVEVTVDKKVWNKVWNAPYKVGDTDGSSSKVRIRRLSMKKKRNFNRREYKKAFQIACSLMNGDIWYGVDKDTIYTEVMEKNGCFSATDYEKYILNNLIFFRSGGEHKHDR